jgi:hypothetical protein
MLNIALSGFPDATIYQNYYGGHLRKKNGHTCYGNTNPKIKVMLFDPGWVRASKWGKMQQERGGQKRNRQAVF